MKKVQLAFNGESVFSDDTYERMMIHTWEGSGKVEVFIDDDMHQVDPELVLLARGIIGSGDFKAEVKHEIYSNKEIHMAKDALLKHALRDSGIIEPTDPNFPGPDPSLNPGKVKESEDVKAKEAELAERERKLSEMENAINERFERLEKMMSNQNEDRVQTSGPPNRKFGKS